MNRSLLAVITLLALSGCASAPHEHKESLVDRDGIDVIGAPADRTQVMLSRKNTNEIFCKGPGPDFHTTGASAFQVGSAGVGLPVGGSVGTSAGTGAVTFGGRSPILLLARELFYRTCEVTANLKLDQATALATFKMTLDAVERMAASQNAQGTLPESAAPPAASLTLPPITINKTVTTQAAQSASTTSDSDSEPAATPSSSTLFPTTP